MTRQLILKAGRDVPVRRGHPWIFSGAIARDEGDRTADEADVVSDRGEFLGRATIQETSEIRARLFDTAAGAALDAAGIRERVRLALARRRAWLGAPAEPAGERVVFSESDGLPGLIADRYGDTVVVQFLTTFMDRRREAVCEALMAELGVPAVVERSDADAREHEGLEARSGVLRGPAPAGELAFEENGLKFLADWEHGHKTGFYLDQRVARAAVAGWVARSGAQRVLDVFAYTGAFGLYARRAGAASVTAVDTSAKARETALRHYALNGFGGEDAGMAYRLGDAFEVLREMRKAGERYDAIVLDPPKLTPSRAALHRSLRAYKDINLTACRLLKPGGLLFTFCCSGLVDRDLFGKVIEGAARDAGRALGVLEHLFQAPDHPGKPGFGESEYLKGFVLGG